MLELRAIDLGDLEAHALSIQALEERLGCRAAPKGVLPSGFVQEFLETSRLRPDWLGCWAILDGLIVGSAMFKGRPQAGTVEIGYGVAPSHEGQGIGTAMAGWMKQAAFAKGAETVRAHTLRDGFASQTILKKNGFSLIGEVFEEEDGLVLRWEVTQDWVERSV